MPTVTITHATVYHYRTEVALGPHRLMLRPRETRDLSLTSFDLEISPEARIDWSHDVAGNAIATAQFDANTSMLSIRSRTRVDLRAPVWPVFPIAASPASYPFVYSPDDWTDLGALAVPQYADDTGRLSNWVESFVMARPTDTLSLLKDISNGITAGISYQSRETRALRDRWRPSTGDGDPAGTSPCCSPRQSGRLASGPGSYPDICSIPREIRWDRRTPVPRTHGSRCSFPERAGSRSTRPTDRSAPPISFPSPSRGGSSRLRRSAEVSTEDQQTSCRWKCAWMSKTPGAGSPE
jgi:hypothetical protein